MDIIAVGHSIHTRALHTDMRDGLKHYVVRLQTDGSCKAVVGNVNYTIRPGDLLLCKPGESYELIIGDDAKGLWRSADYFLLILPGDPWLSRWWDTFRHVVQIRLGLDHALISMWKLIRYEKRRWKKADAEIVDCLLRSFFLHLGRLILEGNGPSVYDRSVANGIKDYIEKRATTKLTLQDISSHVGLSVSRASQLFKTAFNQSIMDYVIEVRLTMAKEYILIGGNTLEEVAYLCGFSNYIHFSRSFRSRYALSPSQYRKQTLNTEKPLFSPLDH